MNRREFITATATIAALGVAAEAAGASLVDFTKASEGAWCPPCRISPVHYHSEGWLQNAGLPAKFFRYRDDCRDVDVWRITCEWEHNTYGFEDEITMQMRLHAGFDADVDELSRAFLTDMLDAAMVKHQRA